MAGELIEVEEEADPRVTDPLYVLRHSSAHVLAAAVCRLWPGAKYAIGPPIEDGFYYDFDLDHKFSPDDFQAIEKEMRRIIGARTSFEHRLLPWAEAVAEFESRGQDYKLLLVRQHVPEGEPVSVYVTGEFLDFCRGPHVENAGQINGQALKLMKVAGAYWRGSEKNPMLQRLYATAWPTPRELAEHLEFLADAERRDHKRLGRELKLFATDDRSGLGLPLWLPAGATIRREIERWVVDEELARGYQHVITPNLGRLELFQRSGHYAKYADAMYPPMQFEDTGETLELRPMTCPHHILVYQSEMRSYRDLPLRIAEVAMNYRYERSGTLSGMNRVRAFALNDAHIFCTPEQMEAEVRDAIELALSLTSTLGVDDYWFRLSVRDDGDKWVGTDEQWGNAEAALVNALTALGMEYRIGVGEAAFYGPKIDFQVRDAHRREFTNSTVQVDFQLPLAFELEYVAEDGSRQVPVMVHRGAAGSMERLFSYLIERWAGAFPTWMAPVQVVLIPITDAQVEYARDLAARMRRLRFRVEVDDSPERMQKKIRAAQLRKVPYMGIIGAREAEEGRVNVRNRAGDQTDEQVDDFLARVGQEVVERRRPDHPSPAS